MKTCQLRNSDLLQGFPKDLQAKIIEFAVKRENQGYKDVKNVVRTLKWLYQHGADLYDPESVKEVVKKMKVKSSTKAVYCTRYQAFLQYLGGVWEKPKYIAIQEIPFVPLEKELDQLIAGLSPRIATFCQIAKETAARSGEIAELKWTDIDFERKLIRINNPEKGSNPRLIKVSEKCLNMIKRLPRKGPKLFTSLNSIRTNFYLQRNKLAAKLNNPKLLQIHLHTFRHWKATMEYHKTHDIFYVQRFLGHKNIQSTMIYVTIESQLFGVESDDEFTVKVASSLEEFVKLLEVGFEYVCDYEGKKVLRKRK